MKSHAAPALWRGRLAAEMHPAARRFLSSFAEDLALVDTDIDVGEAHVLELARGRLFSRRELARVLRAYEAARRDARRILSRPSAATAFHDVHPVVERLVIARCGEDVGGRVHLGKSRNDQVATDICVFARRGARATAAGAAGLQRALLGFALTNATEVVPAYTHGRAAQPTYAGHWALAWFDAASRDAARLLAAATRLNRCPLGAAAVAGTSVPLDRARTAALLGFDGVWDNALDATGARDHVLELLAALAIFQHTLSRLAADVIALSSEDAGVLSYPDAFADTSSAMPQKKNPDPLELVRARAGTVAGDLSGALAIVHGLGGGYSRDLQELKVLLWRSLATVRESAEVTALVVAGLGVRPGRGAEIVRRGFATAMDLADRLSLERGVPFRRAHFAVGRLVRTLAAEDRTFADASAAEASRLLSDAAGRPVLLDERTWRDWTDAAARTAARRTAGGPGDLPNQFARARRHLDEQHARLRALAVREERARKLLRAAVARSIKPT